MMDDPPRGSVSRIDESVRALNPWITKFVVLGQEFGGSYDATTDERISRLPVFVPRARRILECGCLEGGHTALLGRVYPHAEIVAVDVRESNLVKARLLTSVAGIRPPQFLCRDLETAELGDLGHFDLVVWAIIIISLVAVVSILAGVVRFARAGDSPP